MTTTPTVDDILTQTAVGGGQHRWNCEGGSILLSTEDLFPVLTAAYDPSMPDWPTIITWDDDTSSLHIA